MDLFHYISRYFWGVCLVVALINFVSADKRIGSSDVDDKDRADIARRYLRRFSVAGAIPWLIMGWGQVVGNVPTVWYYFRPQDENPYVIAWLGSIFLLSLLYAVWIFFADGARKIHEYELFATVGMRNIKSMPRFLIKLLAAFGPVFVGIWVYLTASMNVSIPQ